MRDNFVLGKYTAPAAPVQGHTEAEGYAASIRQMVRWIKEGDIAEIGDIDTDELLAAANLIIRSYQRIDELTASLTEMVSIYWGDGDGIHPPPACIQRAMAALHDEVALLEPFPGNSA